MTHPQANAASRSSVDTLRRAVICRNIRYLQRLAAASTDNPRKRISALRVLGEEMCKLHQGDQQRRI
jgi:hypothetical protein